MKYGFLSEAIFPNVPTNADVRGVVNYGQVSRGLIQLVAIASLAGVLTVLSKSSFSIKYGA